MKSATKEKGRPIKRKRKTDSFLLMNPRKEQLQNLRQLLRELCGWLLTTQIKAVFSPFSWKKSCCENQGLPGEKGGSEPGPRKRSCSLSMPSVVILIRSPPTLTLEAQLVHGKSHSGTFPNHLNGFSTWHLMGGPALSCQQKQRGPSHQEP